jgi:uncharacterized membrane protein YphA (DoxX/SURF4 family)
MTEGWIIGWALGGAAVVVAALLLLAIIVIARGIGKEAERALRALRRIDANTRAIWGLGRTAKRFSAIHDGFEALEDHTARPGAAGGETTGGRAQ